MSGAALAHLGLALCVAAIVLTPLVAIVGEQLVTLRARADATVGSTAVARTGTLPSAGFAAADTGPTGYLRRRLRSDERPPPRGYGSEEAFVPLALVALLFAVLALFNAWFAPISTHLSSALAVLSAVIGALGIVALIVSILISRPISRALVLPMIALFLAAAAMSRVAGWFDHPIQAQGRFDGIRTFLTVGTRASTRTRELRKAYGGDVVFHLSLLLAGYLILLLVALWALARAVSILRGTVLGLRPKPSRRPLTVKAVIGSALALIVGAGLASGAVYNSAARALDRRSVQVGPAGAVALSGPSFGQLSRPTIALLVVKSGASIELAYCGSEQLLQLTVLSPAGAFADYRRPVATAVAAKRPASIPVNLAGAGSLTVQVMTTRGYLTTVTFAVPTAPAGGFVALGSAGITYREFRSRGFACR